MHRLRSVTIGLCLLAAPAFAQTAGSSDGAVPDDQASGGSTATPGQVATMSELVQDGYEIKAAVPSGTDKLIIFMQNDKSAYACEFTNLANTRCGSIN
ncbi:hypothetical protein [Gellertiella hungarica]|uniref:Uncharacterized protein n=1 Tax=Gellertiella hungarica TaxID=1572859 RepID=A0A7W6JA47_9HYPH|nr:hypothetical protein [Gellertiella hungarica]MBB4066681.1 hypothetical protein [Gellertiella hungarica]